jgi:hypothetical protein
LSARTSGNRCSAAGTCSPSTPADHEAAMSTVGLDTRKSRCQYCLVHFGGRHMRSAQRRVSCPHPDESRVQNYNHLAPRGRSGRRQHAPAPAPPPPAASASTPAFRSSTAMTLFTTPVSKHDEDRCGGASWLADVSAVCIFRACHRHADGLACACDSKAAERRRRRTWLRHPNAFSSSSSASSVAMPC